MKILRNLAKRRSTMILGVLGTSLFLRGCVTEERNLNGSVPITVEAEFTTQGFVQASGTTYTVSDADVDAIFDALADADIEAVQRAVDDDRDVLIGGLSAVVVENRGHVASRTGALAIDLGSGLQQIAALNPTTNATGAEASFANGGIAVDASGAAGLTSLKGRLNTFLQQYLAGDLSSARTTLRGLTFRADWQTADPAPTAQDPDDFDWTVELVVLVPAQYAIEVPNF